MTDEKTRQKIADWQREPETRRLYIEYLKDRMTDHIGMFFKQMDLLDSAIREGNATAMVWHKSLVDGLIAVIHKIQGGIIAERNALNCVAPLAGQITDDDIARARMYPFEELLEFKNHFTRCPFHEDHTPSMSLKNNRVRCWSCMDKSIDPIAFVMMKEGINFIQAVRRLNA